MPEPNGTKKLPPKPFQVERSLVGAANGFFEIAERVVNGDLGVSEASAATKALSGVPTLVKTHLEAIRIYEKGSEHARAHAAKILELGTSVPTLGGPKAA